MLKLIDVCKKYENLTIGPINLELKSNQIISIIGHSGAGKTTLIKMIAQENFDQGKIELNNMSINISEIAYITQKSMLFNHLTILENFQLLKLDTTELDDILRSLNLETSICDKYPFEISGGQAQRINFARVLMQKSKLILLDEAFSALDVNSKDEIYDLIYNLMKKYKLLIILVTHDIQEAVMLSDTILVMNKGQIISQGDAHSLLTNNNKYIDELISNKRKNLLKGLI